MWCRAGPYRSNKWKTQREIEENNEPPHRGTSTRASKTHERPLFCVNNHVHMGRLACSLDVRQPRSLIQLLMLMQYNCTRKEMRWRSGVGARRRKSGATLAFPDASTCFRTIAASVPSQRAQWPRSHTVPSLSAAGRAASEPIVVHVKESPEFALYSSRFSHWFSSSLRPQRGGGGWGWGGSQTNRVPSLLWPPRRRLLWSPVVTHLSVLLICIPANRDSDRLFCFIIQTLSFILVWYFFSCRQWRNARRSCHRSADHQDSHYRRASPSWRKHVSSYLLPWFFPSLLSLAVVYSHVVYSVGCWIPGFVLQSAKDHFLLQFFDNCWGTILKTELILY